MNIAFYCQHVLGIGHFHRSLAICQALAVRHRLTLIVGGPAVTIPAGGPAVLQLPGLQMDAQFQNLEPCLPGWSLAEIKNARRQMLFDFFEHHRPEVFITELYPFGRKAFRFELDPILAAIAAGELAPCRCYCSLRDILVERPTDQDKFEQRAIATLNRYYHGLLVHTDERIIPLAATFTRMDAIQVPICATGFVSRPWPLDDREALRGRLGLTNDDQLIVASIGGGSVGGELLSASLAAFRSLPSGICHLQIFTGPYADPALIASLRENPPARVSIDCFSDEFPAWLQAADLSISMAGYNTCMNILQAGVPALVYPFDQNREQRMRAQHLQKNAPLLVLRAEDLQPGRLAAAMMTMLGRKRQDTAVRIDGAAITARQIDIWQQGDR